MKYLLLILLVVGGFADSTGQTVTIKEYVDKQDEWIVKYMDIRFANIDNNVTKANASMERRLDGMNEFRDALKDSNATYITRTELIAWVIAAAGLFWGWSRHQREQRASQGQNIKSGDTVEVKK